MAGGAGHLEHEKDAIQRNQMGGSVGSVMVCEQTRTLRDLFADGGELTPIRNNTDWRGFDDVLALGNGIRFARGQPAD